MAGDRLGWWSIHAAWRIPCRERPVFSFRTPFTTCIAAQLAVNSSSMTESRLKLSSNFSEVRDLDGLSILAWCLLESHYHLVFRTRFVPLWRSMARIQGRVARGHNRRRRYLGRDRRPFLDIEMISRRFEAATGHLLQDLASRRRDPGLVQGRIEFTAIAAATNRRTSVPPSHGSEGNQLRGRAY